MEGFDKWYCPVVLGVGERDCKLRHGEAGGRFRGCGVSDACEPGSACEDTEDNIEGYTCTVESGCECACD